MEIFSKLMISFFAIVCVLLDAVRSENILQIEKETLDSILNYKVYDGRIRPYGENETGPVKVRVNIYVRSISEIDDTNMEYSTQLTFRQEWKDSRLKYDTRRGKIKYLTLTDPHRIWTPDTFFSNEKDGHFHNIINPNVLMRITQDGTVLYSIRVSLKLSCPMDLRYYPMDKQSCSVILASYGYTTDDVVYLWKNIDPIQITKNLFLNTFTMDRFYTDYCNSRTNTGEYSCLKLTMFFTRELNRYLLQVYIPLTGMVVMSWVSFWLNHHAMVAKVAVWVTVTLIAYIASISIQFKSPAVSYVKAIDVWIGVCLTFLFAALIELALVARAAFRERKQRNQVNKEENSEQKHHLLNMEDHGDSGINDSKTGFVSRWLTKYPSKSQKIDVISRVLFPLAFVIFNLIYWIVCYS